MISVSTSLSDSPHKRTDLINVLPMSIFEYSTFGEAGDRGFY